MINLLFHATIYYEICKFIQESKPDTLTYEMVIEKAKAHERNCLEYKDHQASHGGANSVPLYNNPLLSAHAIGKRRRPRGWNAGQRCGKCGKSHERGNCPTYGKTCNKCKGPNHFQTVCRSKVTAAKTRASPYRKKPQQQHVRKSLTSSNGKGGGKQFFKKKMPKKQPPKQTAYAVTMKSPKTVLKGLPSSDENGNVSNPVLSEKVSENEGTYNRFSCFAVHSKVAQSTNAMSKPSKGLYTDTDPDDRSEIITDVTVGVSCLIHRFPSRPCHP